MQMKCTRLLHFEQVKTSLLLSSSQEDEVQSGLGVCRGLEDVILMLN